MVANGQDRPLERLARLILKGDVVFFIGAGFSIDSEGNSARRMMRRLVLQLLAFVEAKVETANELLGDFVTKFNLDPGRLLSEAATARSARIRWLTIGGIRRPSSAGAETEDKLADDVYDVEGLLENLSADVASKKLLRRLVLALGEWPINRLAREYYPANEWFCQAFESLLAKCKPEHLPTIHEHAENLRREMNRVLRTLEDRTAEPAPLPRIGSWLLERHDLDRRIAGKALFLETLGFADPAVMGGLPRAPTLDEAAASFHERLFARHHVLARFAREGWCPTLITTNFDLLLEGAYRLAGFAYGEESQNRGAAAAFPETLTSSYEVVASAAEFFKKAKAFRTAVVVKMHGCADRYRRLAKRFADLVARSEPDDPAGREALVHQRTSARLDLEECVRSLVFTYREIQNWRGDSWAADYLRTLLRTRTVVFCGYSVADPVIHDTFRSAFEEMARLSRIESATPAGAANGTPGSNAPLFFFDLADERSFHSEAVLNAATEAVGQRPDRLAPHPNRIPFHFRRGAFPDLDEIFRWLQHLTWRERQRECVEAHLARAAAILNEHGAFKQKRRSEIAAVTKRMNDLFAEERELGAAFERGIADLQTRSRFEETTGWTERFHVGLLREFACADDVRRLRMPNLQVATMRRHQWYFPAMENASWTCWGVVVELALRSAAHRLDCEVTAADCARPTMFFTAKSKTTRRRTPWALTVEFAGAERAAAPAPLLGTPWGRIIWNLHAKDAPWPVTIDQRATQHLTPTFGASFAAYLDAPPGALLWRLAMDDGSTMVGPDDELTAGLRTFFAAREPVDHA